MTKAIAGLVLAATLAPVSLWAQQKPATDRPPDQRQRDPQQPRPERQPPQPRTARINVPNPDATIQRIRRALRLTDDQVFQLRALVTDRNLQLAQAQEQEETAQSRRAQVDSIQDQFERQLRGLLRSDQTDRFDDAVLRRPGTFR